MHVIGLTGGIACGKSTVSNRLRALGACILDADEMAHELAERSFGRMNDISEQRC